MMTMRRMLLLYVFTVAFVTSCKRKETVVEQQTTTQTTVATSTEAAPPADMSTADVETLIKPAEQKLFVEKTRIGGTIGQDGAVDADALEFKTKAPIYLTMWLVESPDGLQTSAHLYDTSDKEIAVDRKPANGAKVITLKLAPKNLKPGRYRVVGNWGGNVAAEYPVTVVK